MYLIRLQLNVKNEVIDRYQALYYAEFRKNAQVSIYSLAAVNIGHCVELTFFEGNWEDFLW